MPAAHFQTKPFKINSRVIIKLPKEASDTLPSRGQVMVMGTINGHAIKTALEPDGNGSHWFAPSDAIRRAADVKPGNPVSLALEPTKDWPEPEIPKDWQAALDKNPEVRVLWDRVTPMARWEWIRWINSSGNPETRKRHIEVSCSKLLKGMRRPCCFNRNMCCVPEVSKGGVLLDPEPGV